MYLFVRLVKFREGGRVLNEVEIIYIDERKMHEKFPCKKWVSLNIVFLRNSYGL